MILSVVVPVFNNSKTLKNLISEVGQICQSLGDDASFELILVDDGSKDNSWEIIEDSQESYVVGVKLSRNFGQHAALKAGFIHAQGEFTIMMDADLEDSPSVIKDIYHKLQDGADICFTELLVENKKILRRSSHTFNRLIRTKHSEGFPDNLGTMRGFNRKVKETVLKFRERRPLYGPLTLELGFKVSFVQMPLMQKKSKNSSYNFFKRLQLATDYLIGYTNIIAILFFSLSVFTLAFSVIFTSIIVVQYLISDPVFPPGILFIIVLILILFTFLFTGIGLLGIYIYRLLLEALDRPLYAVDKLVGQSLEDMPRTRKYQNVRCD